MILILKIKQLSQPVANQTSEAATVVPTAVPDPAVGQVNPNPVVPENIVPIDVDKSKQEQLLQNQLLKQ